MNGRNRLLAEWAGYITNAALQGAVTGKPVAIQKTEGIPGPRAGAIEIMAGLDAGKLLRAFAKDDMALARQFIPWAFRGEPQVFMHGRYLRIEAGWPDRLAETMIRLGDLGSRPKGGGRWVAGKNEYGATVIPGLNDRTPHFLVSGATGSGKSVALRNATLQLSQDSLNRLVLLDGKMGESLGCVAHLPGIVGPVATEGPQMRAALSWACQEMRRRYETKDMQGRVIIVFDELQEAVDDPVIVDLLRKLASQGRAAGIHALLATQHPTVAAFGDPAIRRALTGKLALHVLDSDASRVAVGGSTPRADHLLGQGDTYAVAPGAVHRVQGAFVDKREIDQVGGGQWEFDTWPEHDGGAVGQDLPQPRRRGWSYSGQELAVSIVAASEAEGRPAMVNRLDAEGLGRPGAEKAIRLLALGRDAHGWLEDNDFYIGQLVE